VVVLTLNSKLESIPVKIKAPLLSLITIVFTVIGFLLTYINWSLLPLLSGIPGTIAMISHLLREDPYEAVKQSFLWAVSLAATITFLILLDPAAAEIAIPYGKAYVLGESTNFKFFSFIKAFTLDLIILVVTSVISCGFLSMILNSVVICGLCFYLGTSIIYGLSSTSIVTFTIWGIYFVLRTLGSISVCVGSAIPTLYIVSGRDVSLKEALHWISYGIVFSTISIVINLFLRLVQQLLL